MNVNIVIVAGRLTRDPEVRYTPSGTAVAEIGLAVNRTWFDKATNQKRDETTFVDVTCYGRQAEALAEHLQKGSTVLVEGRLQLDTWDDKTTGQKRSKLKVVAESVQFGDRPSGGSQRTNGTASRQPAAAGVSKEEAPF